MLNTMQAGVSELWIHYGDGMDVSITIAFTFMFAHINSHINLYEGCVT